MNFDYKIIRSDRKTISVSVSSDNVISVRCPRHVSDVAVEKFVNSKAEWLQRIIAENNIRREADDGILSFKEAYVCGRKVPLKICDENKVEDDFVCVKDIGSIKNTLKKYLSAGLIGFAESISQQINLRAVGFFVRSYRSRWGCCDRYGKITLNCLAVMLPTALQRYIIIHELCHTVHFNHSHKFWTLVEKFEPDYRACRQRLKRFDYLIKLYNQGTVR